MKIIPFTPKNVNPSPCLSLACSTPLVKGDGSGQGGDRISCPPQVVNRSIDTLHISYHIDYLHCHDLWLRLESKKFALLSTSDDEVKFDFMQTNDEFGFALQRMGKKFFPYRLKTGDITLCLASRSHESNMANMSLEIGSLTCQGDLDQFFLYFHRMLRMLGCKVISQVVSRVDLCSDIAVKMSDLGLDDLSKQICRSQKTSVHHSHKVISGISIGRSSISCRIYDKIKEMSDKQDAVKIGFFFDKWARSGIEFQDITRVEFQLRREFLHEIEVTDFKSLVAKINEVWAYCSTDWLRYSTQSIDRKNKNQFRSIISDFWGLVQDSFIKAVPVVRQKKIANFCDIEALAKQIRGCMTTLLASVGHDRRDFYGMIGTSRDFISSCMADYLISPDFAQRFEARQARFVSVF